jgi:hypothetical protein
LPKPYRVPNPCGRHNPLERRENTSAYLLILSLVYEHRRNRYGDWADTNKTSKEENKQSGPLLRGGVLLTNVRSLGVQHSRIRHYYTRVNREEKVTTYSQGNKNQKQKQ